MLERSTPAPGGRRHTVLARLAERPMGHRALERAEPNQRNRRKMFFLLEAMAADGLIHQSFGEYRLTDQGVALLDHLDRKVDRVAGRRFARAA